MKIIVIGANHSGITCVKALNYFNPKNTIKVYDKNDNISYIGAGLPYLLKDDNVKTETLFINHPTEIALENVGFHLQHRFVDVDLTQKEVSIENLLTREISTQKYDKLVLALGSWPNIPVVNNLANFENVQVVKNFHHGLMLKQKLQDSAIENVTIFGTGYISLELAGVILGLGKTVTLIGNSWDLLPNSLDKNIAELIAQKLIAKGIKLILNKTIIEVSGTPKGLLTKFKTDDNTELATDYLIIAAGIVPQTSMLKDKLDLDPLGYILVNNKMQTSNQDVYAVGDCGSYISAISKKHTSIGLASAALKSGLLAAMNIEGQDVGKYGEFVYSSAFNFNDLFISKIGFNEKEAIQHGVEIGSISIRGLDKLEFVASKTETIFKLIWNKKTKVIVGAQLASENDHTEVMNMLTLAIRNKNTLEDLAFMDYFFNAETNKPINFVQAAILKALNLNFLTKKEQKDNNF